MQLLSQLLSFQGAGLALVILLLYVISLYIYRAYFDHLSHIPGPKLAAATLWYEFYFDVVQKGQYTWEIGRMHEKYGPVVRINPYEVHVNDPEYMDEVYPGTQRRTQKYPWAMKMFGLKYAGFSTENHELHRIRRGAVSHYFSKASIMKLEPGIQKVIGQMLTRLRDLRGSGKVLNMVDVYASLTGDIIGQYAYGKTFDFLADDSFSPWWHHMIMDVSENGHFMKQFSWLMPIFMGMPAQMVKMMNPLMFSLMNFRDNFRKQAMQVKSDLAAGRKPEGQTNIFYEIITNPEIRDSEKTDDYLQDEAQTIISAGTVTTAHILTIITFHLLDKPSIRSRLQEELSTVITTSNPNPSWQELERLPYLTGIIQEGLRMGYGVAHRLQRVFPDVMLTYTPRDSITTTITEKSIPNSKSVTIPAMTPVSMTSVLIHNTPSLFPDPETFNPDRFVQQPELKKYLLDFGKGTRQCLGMQLAYAELYLVLAALFRKDNSTAGGGDSGAGGKKFQFELFETDESDVTVKHDFFNVSAKLDSKGVRVLVK